VTENIPVQEATTEESREIAATILRRAAQLLDDGDVTHARAELHAAEPWLQGAGVALERATPNG
jgi:hypothetical protein